MKSSVSSSRKMNAASLLLATTALTFLSLLPSAAKAECTELPVGWNGNTYGVMQCENETGPINYILQPDQTGYLNLFGDTDADVNVAMSKAVINVTGWSDAGTATGTLHSSAQTDLDIVGQILADGSIAPTNFNMNTTLNDRNDEVSISNSTLRSAIDLGAGHDRINVAGNSKLTSTALLNGGDGIDTLWWSSNNSSSFVESNRLQNIERLHVARDWNGATDTRLRLRGNQLSFNEINVYRDQTLALAPASGNTIAFGDDAESKKLYIEGGFSLPGMGGRLSFGSGGGTIHMMGGSARSGLTIGDIAIAGDLLMNDKQGYLDGAILRQNDEEHPLNLIMQNYQDGVIQGGYDFDNVTLANSKVLQRRGLQVRDMLRLNNSDLTMDDVPTGLVATYAKNTILNESSLLMDHARLTGDVDLNSINNTLTVTNGSVLNGNITTSPQEAGDGWLPPILRAFSRNFANRINVNGGGVVNGSIISSTDQTFRYNTAYVIGSVSPLVGGTDALETLSDRMKNRLINETGDIGTGIVNGDVQLNQSGDWLILGNKSVINGDIYARGYLSAVFIDEDATVNGSIIKELLPPEIGYNGYAGIHGIFLAGHVTGDVDMRSGPANNADVTLFGDKARINGEAKAQEEKVQQLRLFNKGGEFATDVSGFTQLIVQDDRGNNQSLLHITGNISLSNLHTFAHASFGTAGNVVLDGTLTVANTYMDAGRLAGSGIVNGNLIIGRGASGGYPLAPIIHNPGQIGAVGQQLVTGNYQFGEVGTTPNGQPRILEIDLTPTASDRVAVDGNVTFNPGSAIVSVLAQNSTAYLPTKTYNIMQYGGTLTGAPNAVAINRNYLTAALDTATQGEINLIVNRVGINFAGDDRVLSEREFADLVKQIDAGGDNAEQLAKLDDLYRAAWDNKSVATMNKEEFAKTLETLKAQGAEQNAIDGLQASFEQALHTKDITVIKDKEFADVLEQQSINTNDVSFLNALDTLSKMDADTQQKQVAALKGEGAPSSLASAKIAGTSSYLNTLTASNVALRAAFGDVGNSDVLSGQMSGVAAGNEGNEMDVTAVKLNRSNAYVWAKGYGSKGDVDPSGTAADHDYTVLGTTFGLMLPLQGNKSLGLSAGFASANVDGFSSGDKAKIESYQAAISLGKTTDSAIDIDGTIGYSLNDYKQNRNIALTSAVAEGNFNSHELYGQLAVGKTFKVNDIKLRPSASATYAAEYRESYTETGAGALNLDVDGNLFQRGIVQGGLEVSRDFAVTDHTNVTPSFRIGGEYVAGDNSGRQTARFAGSTDSFRTTGAAMDRASLLVGTGVATNIADNVKIGLDYDGKFNSTLTDHTVTASVKVNW